MLAPDQDQPIENTPDTSVDLREEIAEKVTTLRDTLDEDQWDYDATMVPVQESLSAILDNATGTPPGISADLRQTAMDLNQQIERFDQGKFQIWEMRRAAMRYLAVNADIGGADEGSDNIVQTVRTRKSIAEKVENLISECQQGKWGYEDMQPVEQALEPIIGHDGLGQCNSGYPATLKLAAIDLYLLIRAADRGQFDIAEIQRVASQYLAVNKQV
jgi:hypothetical protein